MATKKDSPSDKRMTVHLNFRVEELDHIDRLAKAEVRTRVNFIQKLIKEALAARKQ